jgi:hypothetical protein
MGRIEACRLSAFHGIARVLTAIKTEVVEIPVAADQENRFLAKLARGKISDMRDTLSGALGHLPPRVS